MVSSCFCPSQLGEVGDRGLYLWPSASKKSVLLTAMIGIAKQPAR